MKFLAIFLTAILFSCGGSSQKQSTEVSEVKPSEETSCLSEITDPSVWFPMKALVSLVNLPENNIEQRVHPQFNSCQYNWKTERTHVVKLGNNEMEVPTNNMIAITIKNLDEGIEKASKMRNGKTFTNTEYFDSYHTLATKEEKKIIDEKIDEKAKEDPNLKNAKKLLALAPTENFSLVENLGDKANKYVQLAPGLRETRLAVLHGNVVILVNVDISDDDGEDLKAAQSIAAAILKLCN